MFYPFRHRETILQASRKERHDAIERLIEQGELGSGYYLLLMLATLIITPGLLINNASVVIGGMILAPLMVPLLSLSMSLVSGSIHGLLRSVRILVVSVGLTLVTSFIITLILSRNPSYDVVDWIPAEISPGLYIFIAFCSGVAGAFAWVKKDISSSFAGVAMAVSLLPPLCAAGSGMALQDSGLVRISIGRGQPDEEIDEVIARLQVVLKEELLSP